MNYKIVLIIFFVGTSCAMDQDEYAHALGYRKKFDTLSPDVHEPVVARPDFPECSICLDIIDRMEKAPCTLSCDHTFHLDCIAEWNAEHPSCPLCRGNDQVSVQATERRMMIHNPNREIVQMVISNTILQVVDMLCIPTGLRRRIVSGNSQ